MMSSTSVVVVLVVSLGLLANGIRLKLQRKKQLQLGLSLFCYVQSVINLLQRHRGLSNASYVSGDDFTEQLTEIQQQFDVLLLQTANKELKQFENWQSLLDHWPKLMASTNSRRLTAAQSMRQHSALIGSQFF